MLGGEVMYGSDNIQRKHHHDLLIWITYYRVLFLPAIALMHIELFIKKRKGQDALLIMKKELTAKDINQDG